MSEELAISDYLFGGKMISTKPKASMMFAEPRRHEVIFQCPIAVKEPIMSPGV
jgi:hypothetical protein